MRIRNRAGLFLAVSALLFLPGCASVLYGDTQAVTIVTHEEGTEVAGAECTLENNSGRWHVTTPGTVTVERSWKDMTIVCEKDGHAPGTVVTESDFLELAGLLGNLFTGEVGLLVDLATSAAFAYPETVRVEMGKEAFIEM